MEVINLLLGTYRIDVNLCPEFNLAPLVKAISCELVEVVESLFARDDLDLNVVHDSWGDHALLYLIESGLGFDKMKAILDHTNIDFDFVGIDGRTALIAACYMDKEEIEFLLDQSIDINQRVNTDMTTFDWAVRFCRSKVINLLLGRGLT
jgi:Ankyrin repeats (3 copies)